MGCCKTKSKQHNISQLIKQNEYFDKDIQERKLYEILAQINSEIQLIKQGKTKYQSSNHQSKSSFEPSSFTSKQRSCYLAQLVIFVRWTIKVRQVNQADRRFDEIIAQIGNLVDNSDEFLLNSLENKIRHILNKK